MSFHFAYAEPDRAAEVQTIYAEAAAWQQAEAVNLWPPFSIEFLREQAAQKLLILSFDTDDNVCGCFGIAYDDPYIWSERNQDPALYIHRLAIRRSAAGQGFTAAALSWAQEEARQQGLHYLRLDSWADNPRLCAWYERSGFVCLGEHAIPAKHDMPSHYDGITVRLYQIEL